LRSDGNTQFDGFYFDDFQVFFDEEDDSSIDALDGFSIHVYPNPAQDFVQILCSSPMTGAVRVVDAFGREIATTTSTSTNQHFTVSTKNFANGVYYLLVENQNGQFVSKRFSIVR